ncbi:MAG TPA: nucleotide disphospho-sugar-binding domain-containing protein [Thermoleophilaceae bacterium]
MATIVFFPEGAYGPTNNCIGIGQVLRRRGHRVVFVIEESFAGTLEEKGFEERLMRLTPPGETEEEPGQFWKDFIRDTGPVFRKPTIEQLEGFIQPTWQALVDGAKHVDDRLTEIFEDVCPDVIVEDNVVGFRAVVAADCPWMRIVSCNPLEVPDPELPPVFSGYPTGDRSGWDEFRQEYRRVHADMHADFNEFMQERGCPALPDLEFIHRSPYLNLFLYPGEADYERSRPLGAMWERLGSCVRKEGVGEFEMPQGDGPLVYLSLGSLGSADVELMQRLVDLLAAGGYRAIVSKGPQHDQIELRDGQAGAELVPQPALLPLVDAVITHGGNNTVTECLHFGKPMVLLPLFWDQYDNAQRMDELGLGVRLPTFEFEDAQLGEAIERLTGDEAVGGRLREISAGLQANPGTERAADCIESVRSAEPRARDRAI